MIIDSNKFDSPIYYVCFDCGNKADKREPTPESAGITSHMGICDICNNGNVAVCSVRDFGYPVFEVEDKS